MNNIFDWAFHPYCLMFYSTYIRKDTARYMKKALKARHGITEGTCEQLHTMNQYDEMILCLAQRDILFLYVPVVVYPIHRVSIILTLSPDIEYINETKLNVGTRIIVQYCK